MDSKNCAEFNLVILNSLRNVFRAKPTTVITVYQDRRGLRQFWWLNVVIHEWIAQMWNRELTRYHTSGRNIEVKNICLWQNTLFLLFFCTNADFLSFLHCVSLDIFSLKSIWVFGDVSTESESDIYQYYNPNTRYL